MDAIFVGVICALWAALVLMVRGLAALQKPEGPRP